MLGTSLKKLFTPITAATLGVSSFLFISAVELRPAIASEQQTTSPGISLYGETSEANATGQGYIIFEEQGSTLIGAFYYPQSEFSCFTGHKTEQQLEILSLPNHQDPMASFSLSLQEMHNVQEIGTSEKEALATCRQDVIAFLRNSQTAFDLSGSIQQ